MYREAWSNIENDQTIFARSNQTTHMTPLLSRRIICEQSTRRWRITLLCHLPRDLVRLMTVVTNEELEMSTCEVVDVDDVPVRTPGLRGLQIAVMLKLRLG